MLGRYKHSGFYTKSGYKSFIRLIPDVNFTSILRAAFLNKSFCAAFMCLQFGFVIFWRKDFGTKTALKMLVKLTPDVNFIKLFFLHS
jgi:hypothetical protein